MRKLTPEGERIVDDIAQRHSLSPDAVKVLLEAVANGGGSMAQFSHPELGGGGQWLRGGMTMVGDMFNHGLKAKVDAVCAELSEALGRQPFAADPGSDASQSRQDAASVFVPQTGGAGGQWWPGDLGQPGATGSQNSMRYAYFPEKRRLALDIGAGVALYDTLDHSIQGFGQQQGGDASIRFTSQHGLVALDSLPRIGQGSPKAEAGSERPEPAPKANASAGSSDVFAALERLGALKEKGILTAEEFSAKKAELLKRL